MVTVRGKGESCLKHLPLPLFLIQAVDHKGKNTSFGEIMRRACMGRNGTREIEKEEEMKGKREIK